MQYTGQIQDGQMHGQGTLIYPNSERYEVSSVVCLHPAARDLPVCRSHVGFPSCCGCLGILISVYLIGSEETRKVAPVLQALPWKFDRVEGARVV